MKTYFWLFTFTVSAGATACHSKKDDNPPSDSDKTNTDTGIDAGMDMDTETEIDTDPLARTPPMGWNSWNNFKEKIDEQQVMETADAMVASGMKDVGYQYIVIDDTWMDRGRDQDGALVPNPDKFPNGLKVVADYIHSLGLKFGIYGDRGLTGCAKYAESGSSGHEQQDANTWASWGVDYLKYDNCNAVPNPAIPEEATQANPTGFLQAEYELMGDCLRKTGRPIVYSMCAWGYKGEWMQAAGHLWRSTGDIYDCWDSADCPKKEDWENGVMQILDQNADLYDLAGPNNWNDPDMLEVGNGDMSYTEYVSHFSLWCMMAAPLIAGNDLRDMTDETRAILTNAEAIAVDQDLAGVQGRRVRDDGDLEVWMKPLGERGGKQKAVVLFNRSAADATISVAWSEIGLAEGPASVRDLWAHADLGTFNGVFSATVVPHGVVMVKIVQP